MGDMTGLVVVGALVVGGFLFKDQIIAMLPQPGGDTSGAGGAAVGGDAGAQQQPAAPATSTTNIIAPTPLGIGYPLIAGYPGYPYGYAPYGGYPWAWPPVIGHFSAPRWFNNYPRYGYPYPRPGPRFLGPPVPAPFPHH